ncbi:MAG: peptidylprolyl isomerase [Candidatus Pacearchaeota archaeon]|jgi:FKBP-type peptidyl-prolyl cis-trans isomerase 2
MKAEKGKSVAIEYTGTFDNGDVFDTNNHEGHCHPLEFVVGAGMVIPGFDKAVENMEKGQEKKFHIEAKDAYGEKREELIKTIPKGENFPPQAKEGMMIGVGPSPDRQIPAVIVKITDKEVTLDLNHPLAGKNLNFNIKVLDVKDASEEEHECNCKEGEDCECEDCECEKDEKKKPKKISKKK